jgi:hypothetical protein
MTTKDKIKKYILDNPHLSNKEVAIVYKTTAGTVSNYRKELRESGKLPKLEPGWNKKTCPCYKSK